jgi:hypothetical protein
MPSGSLAFSGGTHKRCGAIACTEAPHLTRRPQDHAAGSLGRGKFLSC